MLCGMIALQKVPAPLRELNFPVPVLFCPTAKNRSDLQPWTGQHLRGDAEDQKPSIFGIW